MISGVSSIKDLVIFFRQFQRRSYYLNVIKLRMEMENVSKRQQPDHRTDNSRRSPTGLQCSEKFLHQEASFSWPLKQIYIVILLFVELCFPVFGTTFWNFGSSMLFNFVLVWLYKCFDMSVTDDTYVDETRVW